MYLSLPPPFLAFRPMRTEVRERLRAHRVPTTGVAAETAVGPVAIDESGRGAAPQGDVLRVGRAEVGAGEVAAVEGAVEQRLGESRSGESAVAEVSAQDGLVRAFHVDEGEV